MRDFDTKFMQNGSQGIGGGLTNYSEYDYPTFTNSNVYGDDSGIGSGGSSSSGIGYSKPLLPVSINGKNYPPDTVELRLDNRRLTSLPLEIICLEKLKSLTVRYNFINKMPKCIGQLRNLEHLYWIKNETYEIPDTIGYCANLKIVELPDNKLRNLPETFSNLTELVHLILDGNQIMIFPRCLLKLKNLNTLSLEHTPLTTIPADISHMYGLRSLFLENTNVKNLPFGAGKLYLECISESFQTEYKNLHLHYLHIEQADSDVPFEPASGASGTSGVGSAGGDFDGFKKIDEYPEFNGLKGFADSQGEQIEVLGEKFSKNDTLFMILSDKGLREFPMEVLEFPNLEELYLDNNCISFIPEEISQLTKLSVLILDKCPINDLPKSIGKLTLKTLQPDYLNKIYTQHSIRHSLENSNYNDTSVLIFGQNLTEIPDYVFDIYHLEKLDIGNNPGITEIPERIGKLSKLKELYLEGTNIIELPHNIARLDLKYISSKFEAEYKKKRAMYLRCFNIGGDAGGEAEDYLNSLIHEEEDELSVVYGSGDSGDEIDDLEAYKVEVYLFDNKYTNYMSEVDLTWRCMMSFPEELFALTMITHLYLDDNQINVIPSQIWDLFNLKVFSISNNLIEHVPATISQLTKLTVLRLNDNFIDSLPDQMKHLKELKELYIQGNPLGNNDIPMALHLMPLEVFRKNGSFENYVSMYD